MKTEEIRKDVRDYILSCANETLARLGVNEKVKEVANVDLYVQTPGVYEFESSPIRHMPMMFKELKAVGCIMAVEVKE